MLEREEKCFPLLTKGDEGGLDSLFQRAKVLHLLENMRSHLKDIMTE